MTSYVTNDEAAAYIGVNFSSTAELASVISAVSRVVDNMCGDFFGRAGTTDDPEDRTFTADGGLVTFGPFNSLVEAVEASADFELVDPPRRSEPVPYRQLTTGASQITVSGVWGWPQVPEAVRQACLLQTARLFKRAESPLGVAGFGEFGVVRVSRLDPDVSEMLAPYRRGDWWGVA